MHFFYHFLPIDVFCDPPHHHVHLGAVIGDVPGGHRLRPAVTKAPTNLHLRDVEVIGGDGGERVAGSVGGDVGEQGMVDYLS